MDNSINFQQNEKKDVNDRAMPPKPTVLEEDSFWHDSIIFVK